MSAYICDKKHIVYLVASAMSRLIWRSNCSWCFSWHHEKQLHQLPLADFDRAAEVANMLWLENIKSVSHRYPGDKTSATLPGPTDGNFLVTARDFAGMPPAVEPVQLMKSIACFEYQSCEHPGWEQSNAHAFCRSLESSAIHALPGWDGAAWGAPEKKKPARA